MDTIWKDYVALVTGGASGIGKATAEELAKAGAHVIIFDLEGSEGQQVASQIGENCVFVSGDVTEAVDVQNCIKEIRSKFGHLNAVINCAAVQIIETLSEVEPLQFMGTFDKLYKINAAGTMRVISEALTLMRENTPDSEGERGVIINFSSILAVDGVAVGTAYSGSKGCVAAMTLPLTRDLGQFGIRVNCIQPGMVDTPMSRQLPPEVIERIAQQFPFPKRSARPDEIVHLIKFLIQNKYINGEIIRMDAGHRSAV